MTSAPTISTNDGFSLKLAGIVALAALGAFFGVGIVRDVLAQWDLGQSANPYIIPSHAFSLYVAVPLVSLACSIFFLAPGLIIATVTGREKALAHWLLAGFGLSIVVLTAATSAFQIATGIVLTGHRFFALVAVVNLVLLVLAGLRLASGQRFRINLRDQSTDLWMSLGLFLAVLILMSPKFYWENFTGDGSGALQFTRLFVHTLWPFWPDDAGVIKQAPGLTSFLFVVPDSWFVRLWGETEYSVRVGHLMGLWLLYPVLTALVRTGRPEARIGIVDHGRMIALGTLDALTRAHGEGESLRLRVGDDQNGPALAEAIGRLPGALGAASSDGEVTALVTSASDILPAVIATASAAGIRIRNIDIQEPNLEAVFLRLTGRALRD